MTWQPIETAPTGEKILVAYDHGSYERRVAFKSLINGRWYSHDQPIIPPTHWMPLPDPPKEET